MNGFRALGALIGLLSAIVFTAGPGLAEEPFYKGKRLIVLINYGAGGPADIEGRLLVRHLAKHIEGHPTVIVQNMDGAGGLVGASYLGEIAPRDGTMVGHLTGTAWRYLMDTERFRVDFKSYEFIAYQPSTTVYYVRTDVPPGIHKATDLVKARGIISGGLGPDNAKDLLIRLGLDLLGVPDRHITSYRNSAAARLALQQGEINFYSESPPSYRSIVHPGIVKEGLAIPVWHDPANEGGELVASSQVEGLDIMPFHEFYRAALGSVSCHQYDQRLHAAADCATARRARRSGGCTAGGCVPACWRPRLRGRSHEGDRLRAGIRNRRRYQPAGPFRHHGATGRARIHRRLRKTGRTLGTRCADRWAK